jgi:hypothetical protein
MGRFDQETLRKLDDCKEVAIRTTKHPGSTVTIWVVVSSTDVFVRSVRGAKGRWYRDLATGGAATLEFNGEQVAVQAVPTTDALSIERASQEFFRSTGRAPMRHRLCAQRYWKPHCDWTHNNTPTHRPSEPRRAQALPSDHPQHSRRLAPSQCQVFSNVPICACKPTPSGKRNTDAGGVGWDEITTTTRIAKRAVAGSVSSGYRVSVGGGTGPPRTTAC